MPPHATWILIVEDNAIAREGLAVILRREGFDVAMAEDGVEALTYLRTLTPPALILLDMVLPSVDGWLFLEHFAELNLHPQPKIIVTTGSSAIDRGWALAHGCQGLVSKPIESDILLHEIYRCLDD